jgi:hypothetical protein
VSTIIRDLKVYQAQPTTNATAENAILLLKLLPPDVSKEHRQEILVPDSKNNLLSLDNVYYNDIRENTCLIPRGSEDVHIAHPALHEDLATMLHMKFLGLKFGASKRPGRNMGERLTTTIRNKLKDYKKLQLLTEFVANAADAGAKEFGILIDEYKNSGAKIISRKMDRFQACPSLIIHNDATFKEEDFDGICNTGIGGKQERTDSIGQFGSGALTMFHFSEASCVFVT